MARSKVLTASGVASPSHGYLYKVLVSKVATGTGSITIYDNATTNSGAILFQGDGLAQQSFDFCDSKGNGIPFSNGLYVTLGGTTNATVTVVCN